MSFLAALTPKVEMSFGDVVDEVHRLREENAALRTQVGMLCSGAATGAEPPATAPPAPGLKLSQQEQHRPPQELAVTVEARSVNVVRECLASELARVEASAERGRVQEAVAREELAMRCEELGRALEQRVLQAEQKQAAAVAAAQQQSAAAVAALEEQVTVMTEEAARREALAETYGEASELAESEQRTIEAVARFEHKAAEVSNLRTQFDGLRTSHTAELRRAEARAEEAEAALAGAAHKLSASEATVRQMEGQLVRLSEGFNKQVEEVVALQQMLKAAKSSTVDKATARSWLVTYVEKGGGEHGEELLRLMADWWEFSREDVLRVGMSDEPHPDSECRRQPRSTSLADAFAVFLEDGDEAENARPPPRSPTGRLPAGVSLAQPAGTGKQGTGSGTTA